MSQVPYIERQIVGSNRVALVCDTFELLPLTELLALQAYVSGLLLGKLVQFLDQPESKDAKNAGEGNNGKKSSGDGSVVASDDSNDEYKHVATVLNNVSNIEEGRRLLTDKDGLAYGLPAISFQIRTARHPERREGAVSDVAAYCLPRHITLPNMFSSLL